jgi:hypothetical protein
MCGVEVTYPANAIKFRASLLNIHVFTGGENTACVNIGDVPIKTANENCAITEKSSINAWVRRKHSFIPNDVTSNADLPEDGIGRSSVNAGQVHGYWLCLPNISDEPKVFHANFWAMRGNKFFISEIDRRFSYRPEGDGGDSENTSEKSDPSIGPFKDVLQPRNDGAENGRQRAIENAYAFFGGLVITALIIGLLTKGKSGRYLRLTL